MKLLYVAVYDPHVPLTGTGTRGFHTVGGLAQRFTLDLVYMEGSGQPPPADLPTAYTKPIDGVRRMERVPFSAFGYFVFSRRLHRTAASWAATGEYDGLICDYGLAAAYGLRISRSTSLPMIYFSHNVEFLGTLKKVRKDLRRLPLVPHNYLVERRGVERSRLTVAISESDAAFFERWVEPERLCVVPQGFDEGVFHPPPDEGRSERPVVLFCGNYKIQFNRDVVRVSVEKGGIVDRVAAAHPDVLFRFVGAHPPTDVEHPNVEFTGFVDDYPALLRAADVVMTPMLQGGGFPTKVIEALACGKHVVATPVGARAIDPSYRTLHVTPLEEFPDEISRLLDAGHPTDPVDVERLRKQYSWDALVGRMADRIERALADG